MAAHLTAVGWSILASSVRIGRDELDLVAVEPGALPMLVFVEVRSRSSARFGAPEETVTGAKIGRIYRAAMALMRQGHLPDGHPLPPLRWRVDLISVDARPSRPDGPNRPELRHIRGVTPG